MRSYGFEEDAANTPFLFLAASSSALDQQLPFNTAQTATPARRHAIKPEDIGTFDGASDRLKFFLGRVNALVQSRRDPTWELAIINVLPLCLRDTAAQWYQLLGPQQRTRLNTSWTAWETALRKAFQPDASKIRRIADKRRWEWSKESIAAYYYAKLSLLRAAYPTRLHLDLIHEIRLGLPASLQLDVRTHMAPNPTMDNLLLELRSLEGPWRAALRSGGRHNARNNASPSTTTPTTVPIQYGPAITLMPSATSAVTPGSTTEHRAQGSTKALGCSSLAASYVPGNVTHIDRDGRRVRAYKLPHSGQVIYLGRPCCTCSQDHFDFEHDFLARQPKAKAHLIQAEMDLVQAYGYPMICMDPIYIDDDEPLTSPDQSLESISSGGTHSNVSSVTLGSTSHTNQARAITYPRSTGGSKTATSQN